MSESLGDRISRLRVAVGMSQETAAMEADLSHVTWARLERDRIGDPKLSTLCAVAMALRVPVSALLFSPPDCPGLSEAEQLQAAGLLAQGEPRVAVILGIELEIGK